MNEEPAVPSTAPESKKRTPNNVCPHCKGERVLTLSRRLFIFWRMPRKWVCVSTSCPSNK